MKLSLLSCLAIVLVGCTSLVSAQGHSHDGHDHHHGHSHEEDVNPSFKYSKQANEQVKKEANHAGHHHHHDAPHHHHRGEKLETKEAQSG